MLSAIDIEKILSKVEADQSAETKQPQKAPDTETSHKDSAGA